MHWLRVKTCADLYSVCSDDVADHAKWAKHFKATRILHKAEVEADTADVEVQLEGEGPWLLPLNPITSSSSNSTGLSAEGDVGSDVEMIFTPGHTEGHTCLYLKPQKVLFSGDHVMGERDDPEALRMSRYLWYSKSDQIESVKKLLQYDFLHVLLPGHGRPCHLRDAAHRLQAVSRVLVKQGVPAR